MTDHDKPTPEREAEIRRVCKVALGLSQTGTVWCDVRDLLAALDAERAAHRETRADVERLAKLEQSWADACADGVAEAYEERDEARRDAVALDGALTEALSQAGAWGAPVLSPMPKGTRDRIESYRKAQTAKNPDREAGA